MFIQSPVHYNSIVDRVTINSCHFRLVDNPLTAVLILVCFRTWWHDHCCVGDTNVSATGLDGQEGGSGSKYITLLLCSVFEIQRSKSIIAGGLWNYIFFHNLFSF